MAWATDSYWNSLNYSEDNLVQRAGGVGDEYSENRAIQCEYKDVNNNGLSAYDSGDKTDLKETSLEAPPWLLSEEDQAGEKTLEKTQIQHIHRLSIVLKNSNNSLTGGSKKTLKQKFKTFEGSFDSYEVDAEAKSNKKLHLNGVSKSELTKTSHLQQSKKEVEKSRRGRNNSVKELRKFFENSDENNSHQKRSKSMNIQITHKPSLKKIKEEALLSGNYQTIKQSFEEISYKSSSQPINYKGRINRNASRRRSELRELSYEELEEADAILIEEMSIALEKGDIVEVVKIIDANQHLVNVVPPKIGLGPLHQAALKGEVCIVNKLLNYPASNPDIKTTAAELNPYGAEITAEELTDREDVKMEIRAKKHELSREYIKCPTLVDISDSNLILMDYTIPSIEKNRGVICSEMFQSSNFNVFTKMMEDVFLYAHFTSNWEKVREIACGELIRFDNQMASHVKELETRESFYNNLLVLYTSSKLAVFKNVNEELRNQAVKNYKSIIRFSVYSALVSSILFVWEDLLPYTEVTYRGMRIEREDLDKYSVGTEFAWLTFVSSTSDQKIAKKFGKIGMDNRCNCLFIFDNKMACKWSPKSIENISEFKREKEYLYPCGAQFKVIEVDTKDEKCTQIYLELICTVDPTKPRSLFDETVEKTTKDIEKLDEKVKQFGNGLSELNENVETVKGAKNNGNNEVQKEEEMKAKIETFLNTMGDDKSDIKSLLMEIKENIKLLDYGLTGGESIGKNLLNKLFPNKNREKQRSEIQRLKEKLRPIKKLMKKYETSFIETSEHVNVL